MVKFTNNKIGLGGFSMKEKMLLKKICSVYANDLHFATMVFPFIHKEVESNTTIRTILEKDEEENIEKILNY